MNKVVSSHAIPERVFFIAEIGINHNGDMEITKKLIDMAKDADCDAVKFQKRDINTVYTQELLDSPRESPWGTTQREQKEGLEFGKAEYDEIDRYCREKGIEWFASAWDVKSQEFLRQYPCKYNKVASAMLTHLPLLEAIASEGKMTFISTGMCTYDHIDAAVAIFKKHNCPFTLLHCVSTYPSDEKDLNMLVMLELQKRYGCPVGYSGHEVSTSPCVMAATLGASVLERHITLSRAMYGSDQSASLEFDALKRVVTMVRKVPVVLGDGTKRYSDAERKIADKLRYW